MATSYVRDQVERGWNVTVACPSRGDLGYAAREAGADGPVVACGAHDSTLPGAVVRLNRIVNEIAPDVVHLHSGKAGLAGRLVVRDRIPTVFQPHAWSFLAARSGVQGASLRWERYAARWTTELVCVSTTERQLGESLSIHAPTTVIPNGIDLAEFRPAGPRDRIHARKLLGLDDVPIVLCVGALIVQKGQQDLLADWPAVRAQVPEAQLILVGDGPDRQRAGAAGRGRRRRPVRRRPHRRPPLAGGRRRGRGPVPLGGDGAGAARGDGLRAQRGRHRRQRRRRQRPARRRCRSWRSTTCRRWSRRWSLGSRTRCCAEEEGWRGRSHVESHHDVTTSARELARVYLRLVGARRGR